MLGFFPLTLDYLFGAQNLLDTVIKRILSRIFQGLYNLTFSLWQ